MRSLSDDAFIKLFQFYIRNSGICAKVLPEGNREQLGSILKNCSASYPAGFIPFFEKIIVSDEIPNAWATPILEGILCHFLYRFGNLAPPKEWTPKSSLPDATALAKIILSWLEPNPFLWEKIDRISDALNVCSSLPGAADNAEPLLFCQYRLSSHEDPEEAENMEALTGEDLRHISCSTVRGKISESVILLASNLLKKKTRLPPLLFPLLIRFATDPHPGVRVSILKHLPLFGQYDTEGAWKLFRAAFQHPHPQLWPYGEPFLWDQCNEHFDNIKHYLARIRSEAFDTTAKTWGKVSALACMLRHIPEDQLINELIALDNQYAWQGVAEAFEVRITQKNNRDVVLLTANKFLSVIRNGQDVCQLEWFYDWLSELSDAAPYSAIQLYENLLSKADDPDLTFKVITMRNHLEMTYPIHNS